MIVSIVRSLCVLLLVVSCGSGNSVTGGGVAGTGGTDAGTGHHYVLGAPLTGVTAISLGARHACALLKDQTVVCWGNNEEGELGDGTTKDSDYPVSVAGLTGAIKISAGINDATCAVLGNGGVQCWGRVTSEDVKTLTDVKEIRLGIVDVCAIKNDGTVNCPIVGLPLGSHLPQSWTTVNESRKIIDLSIVESTCAVISDGSVECLDDSYLPVPIPGITNAVAIRASNVGGPSSHCVLTTDSTLQCWASTISPVPTMVTTVDGLSGVTSFDVGGSFAGTQYNFDCALVNGHVFYWGLVFLTPISKPHMISDITNATSVSAGGITMCSLLADGTVECGFDKGTSLVRGPGHEE